MVKELLEQESTLTKERKEHLLQLSNDIIKVWQDKSRSIYKSELDLARVIGAGTIAGLAGIALYNCIKAPFASFFGPQMQFTLEERKTAAERKEAIEKAKEELEKIIEREKSKEIKNPDNLLDEVLDIFEQKSFDPVTLQRSSSNAAESLKMKVGGAIKEAVINLPPQATIPAIKMLIHEYTKNVNIKDALQEVVDIIPSWNYRYKPTLGHAIACLGIAGLLGVSLWQMWKSLKLQNARENLKRAREIQSLIEHIA